MKLGLEGRVAIVCGASKGIGYACAEALAGEGVKVLLAARNTDSLRKAEENILAKGGTASSFCGDVADKAFAETIVRHCLGLYGTVDILVNNAGGPPMGSFLEHDELAWDSAIQTNLMSVVRLSRAVAPIMKAQNWGRIISITSTVSKEPSPAMVLSATTRAGVSSFTKTLAIELAQFNISVNVVCPGGVLTDRLNSLIVAHASRQGKSYEEVLSNSLQSIPAKRFAEPIEMGNVVLFLASDAGAYVNGVSLSVDGAVTKGYC